MSNKSTHSWEKRKLFKGNFIWVKDFGLYGNRLAVCGMRHSEEKLLNGVRRAA
jgi:hypothetical protein